MNYEAAELYKSQYGEAKLYTDPFEEKLRLSALQRKKTYLTNAQQRELNSKLALEKCSRQKRNCWTSSQTGTEHTGARGREGENRNPENATGKRIVAEADLKKLANRPRRLKTL